MTGSEATAVGNDARRICTAWSAGSKGGHRQRVSDPVVTLGITCYNARDTISRALLSALTQAGSNHEVVVVDDASTDGSTDLLACWKRHMPSLRVIERATNGGVSAARNTLLEHARGEYIVFFDDDDVSVVARVQSQIDAIRHCEQVARDLPGVVCNSARLLWRPNGRVDYEPTIANAEGSWASPHQMLQLVFLGRPVAGRLGASPTCSQAARTDLYRDVGGFDEGLRRGEDTEMNIRLARAGAVFHGIREPLVHQTVTLGADKAIRYEEQAALHWAGKHRSYLEEQGLYDFVDGWFRFKFDLVQRRPLATLRDLARLAGRHPRLLVRRLRDYRRAHVSRRNLMPDNQA